MTNQPTTDTPPAGFRIDQRRRPADAIAFALWTYNREWADRHGALPAEGEFGVACGPTLYADLEQHTDAGTEPRRWERRGEHLHCLRARVYRADTTVVTDPWGFRIVHGDELHPEQSAEATA